MGCGGQANTRLVNDQKMVVHGDIYNSDTRNILTVLDMTQMPHQIKEHDKSLLKGGASEEFVSMDYWPKVAPVIEDRDHKAIGSGPVLVEYCCLRGQEPKRDDKGKPIKAKKGMPPPICLTPSPVSKKSDEINKVMSWFISKFRPHSTHLFATILNRSDKNCNKYMFIQKNAYKQEKIYFTEEIIFMGRYLKTENHDLRVKQNGVKID